MSDDAIDKILFDCIVALGTIEGGAVVDLDTLIIDRRKAAQQIRQFILDEVIGKDLPLKQPFDDQYDEIELTSWRIFRKGANWIKAEQRNKLREPME
jgi:hypothetical protein